MIKTLKIGDKEFSFSNSVWTLKCYKDIFKNDWHTDRNSVLANQLKAAKFAQEYSNMTDEEFSKLSQEKQDKYWKDLKENKSDVDFTLNMIYAMAFSAGYKGTQKDLLSEIPPSELSEDSELMKLTAQFVEDFSPEIKKKVTNQ